jgi:Tol biopolymer transport system component
MPRKGFLAVLFAAAALIGVVLTPVSASYPGAVNGRIAFGVRADDGSFNIVSVLPNGAAPLQLTSGSGRHLCPDYSADGRQLVFCSNVSGAFELWTVKQNGTKATQLTHFGAFAIFPDFSPDGSTIAFSGWLDEPANDQIFVVDAATGVAPTQLTSCPAAHPDCFNSYPVWSPDGSKLAFSHADGFDQDDNPLNEQIWVSNANGSNAHPITTGPAPKDQVPDWSPDGTKIVYTNGYIGSGGIWTVNADGSGAHQLTGCAATDPSPCPGGDDWGTAWSPDGTKIAFLHDLTGLGIADRPVYIINADGSGAVRITTAPGIHAVPAWQARGVGSGD